MSVLRDLSKKSSFSESPVFKLPNGEPWPAAIVEAGAASVMVPLVAAGSTETPYVRTMGDSSPVIFCPSAGRVPWMLPPSFEGDVPPAPAVLAGATKFAPHCFRRNHLISPFFCFPDQTDNPVGTRDHWYTGSTERTPGGMRISQRDLRPRLTAIRQAKLS